MGRGIFGRHPLADQEVEEPAHGDQPAGDRPRGAPFEPHASQQLQQVLVTRLLQRSPARERALEPNEVRAVGRDGVRRQALLDRQVV